MRRKLILAALLILPLGVGAAVYAHAVRSQPQKDGYVCPLTGERLPCPKCCPLNAGK